MLLFWTFDETYINEAKDWIFPVTCLIKQNPLNAGTSAHNLFICHKFPVIRV